MDKKNVHEATEWRRKKKSGFLFPFVVVYKNAKVRD